MPLVPPISAPGMNLVKGGAEAFSAGKKLIAGRAHFVPIEGFEDRSTEREGDVDEPVADPLGRA